MSASLAENIPGDTRPRTAVVAAAAVALVALWAMGAAVVGEPGLPLETIPPTVYAPASIQGETP